MLGLGPAISWDELRSKTDMEISLSIIQALTGFHLGDFFCKDFYNLCCFEFCDGDSVNVI